MFLTFEILMNMLRLPGNGQTIQIRDKGQWAQGEFGYYRLCGKGVILENKEYRKLPLIWKKV